MRSIIFILGMFLYLVISMPFLLLFKLTKNKRIATLFGLSIGRFGNLLAGNKLEIIGKENLNDIDSPVLIISNHEGIFDAFNIYATLNLSFGVVSKKENGSIPLLGLWTNAMDVLLMDRDDMRQSMRIIKQASKNIEDGMSMLIFPEGTRSEENLDFQAGSFKIAEKAKCPILCISMKNTSAIFEKNKRIKSGNTKMHIHPLVTYDKYQDLTTVDIAKMCQDIVHGVDFE